MSDLTHLANQRGLTQETLGQAAWWSDPNHPMRSAAGIG